MHSNTWKPPVLLVGALLLTSFARVSAEPPQLRAPIVSVHVGGKTVSGVLLNSLGHIAAPIVSAGDEGWSIKHGNDPYETPVVLRHPRSGLVILKATRDKGFPFASLAQKQAPLTGKYTLVGIDERGAAVEKPDVRLRRVRRRVPEAGLEGSCYELALSGPAPQPGAALVDPESGEVHGVLLPPMQGLEEPLALFSSEISIRAAEQNIVLGGAKLPDGPSVVFADGRTVQAKVRYLHLGADPNRGKLQYTRAIDDWRRYSGFWINYLTSPALTEKHGYLGSLNGQLYSLDVGLMQREWLFPNEFPVFSPPSVGPSHVVCTNGSLNLTAWQADDLVLKELFRAVIAKTKKFMVDYGMINCVDRASGAFKWVYKTRFLSHAQIVGDHVLYAGMGTLGVLNLADGKEVWSLDIERKDTTPDYYVLAGAAEDQMWVYATKVTMDGKGTVNDPLRLEQQGAPARVECYSLSKKSQLWSTPILSQKDAPALSAGMLLSPDGKSCYGATAKSMFSVDAKTGTRRWQTQVFKEFFGGNLAFGDNMLFGNSADNRLYAVDPTDGNVLWTFEGAKAPVCLPLVQDGIVYVGSLDTWIYALEARTGKLVWKLETGGRLCGQPRIVGSHLYFTSDDGRLTEIELPQ